MTITKHTIPAAAVVALLSFSAGAQQTTLVPQKDRITD